MWQKKLKQLKPWTGRVVTYVSITVFGVVALTRNESIVDSLENLQARTQIKNQEVETVSMTASNQVAQHVTNQLSSLTLDEVKVWNDWARWQGTPPAKRLLESLNKDEFTSSHPFKNVQDLKPIKQLLSLGVADFKRQLFRSPQFLATYGYDTIKYEITHPNGRSSFLFAYKKSADSKMIAFNALEDKRSTYMLFVIDKDGLQADTYTYEDFQIKNYEVAEINKALAGVEGWIDLSTPFVASF